MTYSSKDFSTFKETPLKKYPYLSYSSNLIEYFVIIGYDNLMITNKIIPNISKEIRSHSSDKDIPTDIYIDTSSNFKKYPIHTTPTILSCISSTYQKPMLDNDLLISLTFPNNPNSFYTFDLQNEPSYENIVFFINGDSIEEKSKTPFHVYSFIFYENYEEVFYIPKAFSIVSQFPFYNIYHSLCKHIIQMNKENELKLPLEILVYNIVNYIPSPIYRSFQLEVFPKMNKPSSASDSYYIDKLTKSVQKLYIHNVNGYPLLDYNVCEIFNLLPISMIVEIFLLTFIECDVLFFSENLEVMNIVMCLFSSLAYPCNDTMYLWHIVSVSKEEILNVNSNNRFIGKPFASMLGINSAYDESLETYEMYHIHFIVDLDKKKVILKYDPSDYMGSNTKKEIDQFKLLKDYIEKMVDKKSKTKSIFLKPNIITLISKLEELAKQIPFVNTNSLKSSNKISFFNMKDTQKVHTYNKQFQESFYVFVLDLLREYYSYCTFDYNVDIESSNDNSTNNITLMQSKNHSFKKDNQNSSSFYDESLSGVGYDIQIDELDKNIENVASNSYIQYKENNDKFTQGEKMFNKFFLNSQKYSHYIKQFMLTCNSLDIFKVQYLFSEEFMLFKNKNLSFPFNLLDVIDILYMKNIFNFNNIIPNNENDIITNINFVNFYEFYETNLKQTFNEEQEKYIKITNCISINKQKEKCMNNSINFNNDLLLKYVYTLSNIPNEILFEIFPSLQIKQNFEITSVPSFSIPLSIEYQLIQVNEIEPNDLLIFSLFYITSYFFQCIKNENDLQMILNILKRLKFCLRMYVTILLKGLYKVCIQKLKLKQSIHQEIIYYSMIMDLFKEKNVLPNEEMISLIESFSKIRYNFKMEECEQQLNENSSNEQNERTEHCKFKLIQNICNKCTTEFDQNYFKEIAGESYDCRNLEVDCAICKKHMIPLIYYKNEQTNKEVKVNFYSPMKIYMGLPRIMEGFLEGRMERNELEFLLGVVVNLIIYFTDFDDEELEIPNDFLYDCFNEIQNMEM